MAASSRILRDSEARHAQGYLLEENRVQGEQMQGKALRLLSSERTMGLAGAPACSTGAPAGFAPLLRRRQRLALLHEPLRPVVEFVDLRELLLGQVHDADLAVRCRAPGQDRATATRSVTSCVA